MSNDAPLQLRAIYMPPGGNRPHTPPPMAQHYEMVLFGRVLLFASDGMQRRVKKCDGIPLSFWFLVLLRVTSGAGAVKKPYPTLLVARGNCVVNPPHPTSVCLIN